MTFHLPPFAAVALLVCAVVGFSLFCALGLLFGLRVADCVCRWTK